MNKIYRYFYSIIQNIRNLFRISLGKPILIVAGDKVLTISRSTHSKAYLNPDFFSSLFAKSKLGLWSTIFLSFLMVFSSNLAAKGLEEDSGEKLTISMKEDKPLINACPGGMQGNGDSASPCQITNRAQLEAINDEPGLHYILMSDIDLSVGGGLDAAWYIHWRF